MDAFTLILFVAGVGLLITGADFLVRGSSALAARLGLSPLVIGLTVVAFGTSSPELAVSLMAALEGQADIAFGNVVGSNIFNALFILGLSALITPLVVARQLVVLDVPVMIAVSLVAWLAAASGNVGRLEGLLLLLGLLAYTLFVIRLSRREAAGAVSARDPSAADARVPSPAKQLSLPLQIGLVVAGLALLVLGSRWLVGGAVVLARALGLSELIIGLTIVAAGTSLPEVASSLVAAIRGQRDIAVGNVVGSNIFNLLGVLGLSAAASPGGVPVSEAALRFDVPVMVATAVGCLPIFFTGHRISRWEGALFLGYYAAYTAFLVLDAQEHDALPVFSGVMVLFVVPITAATLGVLAYRACRRVSGGPPTSVRN